MSRIIYGIAGEGMGHAVKNRVILEELIKKNDIKIVASGKAHTYLKKFFNVEKIDHFKFIYRNNKVSNSLTLINNILGLPKIFIKGCRVNKLIKEFKPDLVITDFEPLVVYLALLNNIPIISIDNQHAITNAKHKISKIYWLNFLMAKLVIKLFIIKSDKQIITSFFPLRLKNTSSVLVKPILCNKILKLKSSYKNHIFVYQTSKSNKKLLNELRRMDEIFIVYGFYQEQTIGNLTFRDFNEKEFYSDLSSCKAVITNGGFMMISEALYLKKPILSIPVKKQFEQTLNAIYLEKLGYGMFAKKTSKDIIERFLKSIPRFRNKLKDYKKYDNKEAFKEIDNAIKSSS